MTNQNDDKQKKKNIEDIHYLKRKLHEYMDTTDFEDKKPHQKIGILTKGILDDLRSIEQKMNTAAQLKKDGGITQSDLWQWTPKHVDKIVKKLRNLISTVQQLRR